MRTGLMEIFFHTLVVAAEMFYMYCPFLVEANILIVSVCYYEIKYIYSLSKRFSKRFTIEEYNKRLITKRQEIQEDRDIYI